MTKIVLTGFMGTGKTAVGRLVARWLGLRFFDVDTIIEEEEGLAIRDIFGLDGQNEPYFRQLERNVIARFAGEQDCVIATGGGAILDPENARNLKSGGIIICLTAQPQVILARIPDPTSRPMLKGLRGPMLLARIRELQEARAPFYQGAADVLIDTSDLSVEEVALQILERVASGQDRSSVLAADRWEQSDADS